MQNTENRRSFFLVFSLFPACQHCVSGYFRPLLFREFLPPSLRQSAHAFTAFLARGVRPAKFSHFRCRHGHADFLRACRCVRSEVYRENVARANKKCLPNSGAKWYTGRLRPRPPQLPLVEIAVLCWLVALAGLPQHRTVFLFEECSMHGCFQKRRRGQCRMDALRPAASCVGALLPAYQREPSKSGGIKTSLRRESRRSLEVPFRRVGGTDLRCESVGAKSLTRNQCSRKSFPGNAPMIDSAFRPAPRSFTCGSQKYWTCGIPAGLKRQKQGRFWERLSFSASNAHGLDMLLAQTLP